MSIITSRTACCSALLRMEARSPPKESWHRDRASTHTNLPRQTPKVAPSRITVEHSSPSQSESTPSPVLSSAPGCTEGLVSSQSVLSVV